MRLATEVVLARALEQLLALALGLGHELTDPEADTEVSMVVQCVRCEQIFGVDGQEAPYVNGKLDSPCNMGATLLA